MVLFAVDKKLHFGVRLNGFFLSSNLNLAKDISLKLYLVNLKRVHI